MSKFEAINIFTARELKSEAVITVTLSALWKPPSSLGTLCIFLETRGGSCIAMESKIKYFVNMFVIEILKHKTKSSQKWSRSQAYI